MTLRPTDGGKRLRQRIADEVIAGVGRWQAKATMQGCKAAEIAMFRGAFVT